MKTLTKNSRFKKVEMTFLNLQQLADIFKNLEACNFKIKYEITYNDESTVSEENVEIFDQERYLQTERGIQEIKFYAGHSIVQNVSVDIKVNSFFGDGGISINVKYLEGEGESEKLVNTYQKLVDHISNFKMNQNILTKHHAAFRFISIFLISIAMGFIYAIYIPEMETIIFIISIIFFVCLSDLLFYKVIPNLYMDVEFDFIENKKRRQRKWLFVIFCSVIGVSTISAIISFLVNQFFSVILG
ncbi:hypothetical protein JI642_12735 [Listeria ivanovii subsp. londoniensis]|uniref:Uncharacterized protein n=2 Tax=Listeria ivanovii TaxID=1638 RepID=A0ABS1G888_LISIV|nr:hypothetical protein [Listeria ivanovii]MBK1962965.1 hypothetical protein [Listeria ivanovii subsp. londoniensis]QPL19459.1 hypothetical protein pLIS600116c [Listeria ivanovii]UCK61592.1 hypothetical protein pLIS46_00106c [Listeria ivanovii]UCK61713.1 hypothetical protein pLIS48_00181c [Listeria ivanovii]